jgi:hypothetical protein
MAANRTVRFGQVPSSASAQLVLEQDLVVEHDVTRRLEAVPLVESDRAAFALPTARSQDRDLRSPPEVVGDQD